MLSQRQSSLGVGCHSSTAAPRHHLPALPPLPQLLLAALYPGLQHQLGVPVSSLVPTSSNKHRTSSACDYGVSHSAQYYRPRQTKTEGDRRRMTRVITASAAQTSSSSVHFTVSANGSSITPFTFVMQHRPGMTLSFPPRPSPPRLSKRFRAVTDVDGELSCLHKKKRRLRLFLITSRLSPEFSSPATNIVDRGNSKIAVWAKQKALGRNLLRKAAILNRVRWRAMRAKEATEGWGRVLVEQEREQKQLELARLALVYGSHDSRTRPVLDRGSSLSSLPSPNTSLIPNTPSPKIGVKEDVVDTPVYRSPNDGYSHPPPNARNPRRAYHPLPPSPLGLSNYDALDDFDDDIPDPYSHLEDSQDEDLSSTQDEEMGLADPHSSSANPSASYDSTLSAAATGSVDTMKMPSQRIYSDFNILDPCELVVGDYDQVDTGAEAIWPTTAMPGPVIESPAVQESFVAQLPQRTLPASSSPNFVALFATSKDDALASEVPVDDHSLEMASGSHVEIAQEKERQKSFMFAQFDP